MPLFVVPPTTAPSALQPIHLIEFLRKIWAPALPGTFAESRHMGRGGVRSREFFLRASDGGWLAGRRPWPSGEIFVGVNPRVIRSGRINAVTHYVALFCDFDHWAASAPMVDALAAAGISPSAVVASGSAGHRHAYYFLAAATPVAVAEPVARRLCKALRSDPVFYANACARLPGSVNTKIPGRPRRATLLEMPGTRYTIEEVSAALDRIGAEPASSPARSTRGARTPRTAGGVTATSPAVVNERTRALFDALPAWAQSLVVQGKVPGDRYPSRSEADCAVVRLLLDLAANDEDVAEFFAAFPDGIGARYAEDGDRYLGLTIDHVRDSTPEPSVVVVADVVSRGPNSRVRLDLRVVSGPHAGERFWASVDSTSTAWPFLFRAAGLDPAPMGAAAAAHALRGRELRVVLEETRLHGVSGIQVQRFLPRVHETRMEVSHEA